jgi:TRAP-type C4-dicarboxylate transport system substrate-binding protein
MRRILVSLFALFAVPALAEPQAQVAQAPIELKISFIVPQTHGWYRDWLEPWGQELARRTNGQVRLSFHPGGTTFGNPARQYDQVVAGVMDMAVGLRGVPAGRFNRTGIIEMPFMAQSANAATRALWAVYPRYLREDFPNVKVLGLQAHNGGIVITRDRPVARLEDMRGLRLRTPSPVISAVIQALGAVPVSLPPLEVYENLQRGTLDGAAMTWDAVAAFRLAEVTRHNFDIRLYVASFYFVMNQARYDSLPENVRRAIDETTGDALVERMGEWWNRWDAPGLELTRQRNNTIAVASPEERARWEQALQPMINQQLDQLVQQGVANAREIYDAMRAEVRKYER